MRTRSPFPGMDPWLESYWGDVHHTIIGTLRRQLFSQLPEGLYAAIEENVYVVDVERDRQIYRPDVAVFDTGLDVRVAELSADDGGIAIAEPVQLTFPSEPVTEGHIEIRDLRADNNLITVIEVLSPTNKIDLRGRAAYSAKRSTYIAAQVNLVELDLLRGGEHIVGVPIEYISHDSLSLYKCVIRRAQSDRSRTRLDYYSFDMRHRLPRIRIPLRPDDSAPVLDLQEPIDTAYEEGRFGMRIDYRKQPEPPLDSEDSTWASQILSSAI